MAHAANSIGFMPTSCAHHDPMHAPAAAIGNT
jgi:hypothetical protein